MKYTIMSYNPDPNALPSQYPIGLQQFDIAALQQMYGVNYATRADDTYYTFSSTASIMTIWDGGGVDTIVARSMTQHVVIDLQPGHFSSIGGIENVAMALVSHLPSKKQSSALIEHIFSGSGNDDLIGNKADNDIYSGTGANSLKGMEGNDVLWAEGYNDILDGGVGNDALINSDNNGHNQYIFSRGGGHDGIIDNTVPPSELKILLNGINPDDVALYANRYAKVDASGTQNYYSAVHLKVLSTDDTLVLPWSYLENRAAIVAATGWDYSRDLIKFSNGTTWDLNNYESHINVTNVASIEELNDIQSPLFAWVRDSVPWLYL